MTKSLIKCNYKLIPKIGFTNHDIQFNKLKPKLKYFYKLS